MFGSSKQRRDSAADPGRDTATAGRSTSPQQLILYSVYCYLTVTNINIDRYRYSLSSRRPSEMVSGIGERIDEMLPPTIEEQRI